MNRLWYLLVSLSLLVLACDNDEGAGNSAVYLKMQTLESQMISANSNAEIVRVVPETGLILLLDSKKGQLFNYAWGDSKLKRGADVTKLLAEEEGENEITSAALVSGEVLAVTKTIISTDGSGKQLDCGGELLFVSIKLGKDFGKILGKVEVGPMPDAVAVTRDGKWAITADERDGPDAWGKCSVAGKEPSISIVSLEGGVENAVVKSRISLSQNEKKQPREPEYVAIAHDDDSVAVTLQDSHEVAMFKISEVVAKGAVVNESDIKIVALPANEQGAEPWPDGIEHIQVGGKPYYVIAGEWNDCLITLDAAGNVVSNVQIAPKHVPSQFPYADAANTPRYSPDSLFSFNIGENVYVAASLRHAGAAIVYQYNVPQKPNFAGIVKVGSKEEGKIDKDGSSVRPEGISGSASAGFLVTANEGEGSVSYIKIGNE